MKIRFNQMVTVDMQILGVTEVWDRTFYRWDEIEIAKIVPTGNERRVDLVFSDEKTICYFVPVSSFEVVGPTGLEPVTKAL